mgnify:FL=1
MNNKVRLGIIGIGKMGSRHTQNIMDGKCPEIEITAISDDSPAHIEAYRERFGDFVKDVPAFTDSTALMDSGTVDAVLIATPHYFHPTLAIEAMQRGLHVMCEKPAGVYTKQVKAMNEVAEKCDVVFGLMFNQRTNCVYRKMRELVRSGDYGQIRRTNWIITDWYRPQAYYDSGAWRATWSGEGGGVLLNQCPHNLDLWQWICGMPSKVYTKMHFGKWHNIEVEDDVTTYVEYPNGATGTFVTSTADAPGTNRFEITMDRAKLVVENDKLCMWELDVSEPEFSATNKEAFAQPEHIFREVETDGLNIQHSAVLNAFAGAVLRGEPLVASGEDGIDSLTLSNAMHLSAWTGKEVELPFDDEEFYRLLKQRVEASSRKEYNAFARTDVND